MVAKIGYYDIGGGCIGEKSIKYNGIQEHRGFKEKTNQKRAKRLLGRVFLTTNLELRLLSFRCVSKVVTECDIIGVSVCNFERTIYLKLN